MGVHIGGGFVCPYTVPSWQGSKDHKPCGSAYASQTLLDLHIGYKHPARAHGSIQCFVCRDWWAAELDFRDHYRKHHFNARIIEQMTSGTVPPSKPIKEKNVAAKKDDPTAPVEKYDGEKDSWTAWLGELEDACERGLLDDILRDVAKAIFNRRDVLQGKPPGTSFTEQVKVKAGEALPKPKLKPRAESSKAALATGTFTGKVPAVQPQEKVTVEVGGKHYVRKEVVGKTITVPDHINPPYVRGLRVKIKGVGEKKAMIEWIDLPPENTTWRKDHDAKKPCFLPHSALSDILG